MPRFSIVIPCFNAAATLPATLDSLRAQTLNDWEVLCIDDGSTDTTAALIDAAAALDGRICRIANTGKGPSAARNTGALDHARGDIIAFCDADDLWQPEKLACLAATFQDLFIDACYARIGFFRNTPADAKVFSTVPDTDLTVQMLLGENPVCTMSNIAIRKSAFTATRGFRNDMVHNEDLEWLVRLVGGGATVTGLNETLVWYRTSPTGLSSDLSAMSAGRARALVAAHSFGVRPAARAEAVHKRYLARRALRLGQSWTALRYTLQGLVLSPKGFLLPLHRGAATALGAFCAPFLPRFARIALFSN
jgi:GT2 family glycosyltransferase